MTQEHQQQYQQPKKQTVGQGNTNFTEVKKTPAIKVNKVTPIDRGIGNTNHIGGNSNSNHARHTDTDHQKQLASPRQKQNAGVLDNNRHKQSAADTQNRKLSMIDSNMLPNHFKFSTIESTAHQHQASVIHPPPNQTHQLPKISSPDPLNQKGGGGGAGGQNLKHTSYASSPHYGQKGALSVSRAYSSGVFINPPSSNPNFYGQNRQDLRKKQQQQQQQQNGKRHSYHAAAGKNNKEKGRFNLFSLKGKDQNKKHRDNEVVEDEEDDWDDFSETDVPFDDAENLVIVVPDDYVPIRPFVETMKPFHHVPPKKKKRKCTIL